MEKKKEKGKLHKNVCLLPMQTKKLKVRPDPQKDKGYTKEWFLLVIT